MTGKYVWVNGCFDVLHRGHIELFKYAKSLGDYLIVGVDGDERIRVSKGEDRPVNCLEDRMEMLRSIRYIDEVVEFNTDHELDTQVDHSGAEVMVVGLEYKDKKVIGSRHVKEVKFYRKIDGYSTTKILERSASG
jgi:rfaE bifunctional protein nucleotidyltransferase chain/domain